jgi:hypothetical protein
MADHYTEEGVGFVDATQPDAVEEARKRHHLATADPDLEETMTGPAHERKYGLDREEASAERWRAAGVDPYKNGSIVETAEAPKSDAAETTAAPRAKRS